MSNFKELLYKTLDNLQDTCTSMVGRDFISSVGIFASFLNAAASELRDELLDNGYTFEVRVPCGAECWPTAAGVTRTILRHFVKSVGENCELPEILHGDLQILNIGINDVVDAMCNARLPYAMEYIERLIHGLSGDSATDVPLFIKEVKGLFEIFESCENVAGKLTEHVIMSYVHKLSDDYDVCVTGGFIRGFIRG